MTEFVVSISRYGLESISWLAKAPVKAVQAQEKHREIIFVGITLIALQILDGLLTTAGVLHFGPRIEANPLIRGLMQLTTPLTGIMITKGAAVLVVIALCCLSSRVPWLIKALKIMPLIYLGAAILPWTYVLSFHLPR